MLTKIRHLLYGPEISIFREFHKSPYGGGNQFLLALEKELRRRGNDVSRNKIGRNTKVVLFNSFNFDFNRLIRFRNKFHPKMVHRVDGPISAYRGEDIQIDKEIWRMNHELANKTIFQSEYSKTKHLELGLVFKNASVIPNASDPEIFNRDGRVSPPDNTRKVRLIATSWSNNPKKGGPLLSWLDERLDHSKYELTFVGRTQASFQGVKIVPAVPSQELAKILKKNDIYIAPSQDDPCSNALIEALSSGLPAVYLNSGGHSELVKEAGAGFTTKAELLDAIDKVANDYKSYQDKIKVKSLSDAADDYLKVFEIK